MGRRVAALDWSRTGFGPRQHWPEGLRTLVEMVLTAAQPMFLAWGEQFWLLYNDAFAGLLENCAVQDALGQPIRQGWPGGLEDIEVPLREALGGCASHGHQLMPVCAQPGSACHSLSFTPVGGNNGGVQGVLCICAEVRSADTALQATEARRRASETRFRQLANLGPSMIWFGNPDGSISFINERWYEYTGLTPEQALPLGWVEVIHPQDTRRLLRAWRHARRSGENYEVEAQLRRADGTYRWFLIRALPVRNEHGEITGWLGSHTDIDERKRMETALRSERQRVWTYSTDLMAVSRYDGTFAAVNPAWEALLGHSQEMLVNRPATDLVHPDDLPRTVAEIERLRQGHRTLYFENRLRHRDGSYRDISWTAVPEGGFIHAIGRDITASNIAAERLRQAEDALRQAQKMEAVGQLTGGIAHDFNNLLQGISGSLELLGLRLEQGRTEDCRRFLSSAMASAERAAALTHRLLAFSRRQSLAPRAVAGNALVESMVDLLGRTMGEAVRVELRLAPELWVARCDPHQLESALLNLAINARDAMPLGGRLVLETCNAHLDQQWGTGKHEMVPGDYVCFSVTDTGAGMAPEVVARAFEPFFTTKPLGQGTGLGLAMIYGFARQSGGCVVLDSEPGRGTQVRLYLPRSAEELQAAGDAAESLRLPAADHEVVLVVEDQAVLRGVLEELLCELGYRVLVADDGCSGLEILEADVRVDLLLTDIGLPGLNGREMTERAREQRPELPVIFMTGYAERRALEGVTLNARTELMTKPFALDDLGRLLHRMLHG